MKTILIYIFVFISSWSFAQETISDVLTKYNNQTIPYITSQELVMPKTQAIILDARELKEYEVSHIKNAIHVGYEQFSLEKASLHLPDKLQPIVVYCTLGIRSETIAEKLKNAGYKDVKNLYGGIIDWKNNDNKVYDSKDKLTDKVHVCNEYWSQWLLKGIKVYD